MMKAIVNLVIVLFFSLGAILPLFHTGFFSMHDDTQIPRVYQMSQALSDGHFPVRWVKDLGYGYGYPLFNFYAPLPYYLGGIMDVIGFDALVSAKIMIGMGILLSGASMYFLIRHFTHEIPAIVGALIYMYFPYHAVNVYVRGAVGEVFAYAFLPFVFLSAYKLLTVSDKKTWQVLTIWTFAFGLSAAAVILSHNLSAYMMGLELILFLSVLLLYAKNKLRFMTYIFIGGVLGMLLSAFYVLPALFEAQFTNVISQVGGGADYKDHFVCIPQLWNSMWGYGGSTPTCIDGLSFKLGKLNILLIITAVGFFILDFIKNQDSYRKEKAFQENILRIITPIILLIFSILLTLSTSKPIWDVLPQMEFLQYPWRFLNFVGIWTSVLIGLFLNLLIVRCGKKLGYVFSGAIICFTLVFNLKLFLPQIYFDRSSSYYTDGEYIQFTVSKISDEYLPKDFDKPNSVADLPNERIIVPDGEVVVSRDLTHRFGARVSLKEQGKASFNITHFPSWTFYLDGKLVDAQKGINGYELNISQGSHTVEARFVSTPIEKAGNLISFISILSVILGILSIQKRKLSHAKTS